MAMNDRTYNNVRFSTAGSVLSIHFDSAFGEISVSLSIDALQTQLSKIVSDLLDRFENDDPSFLRNIAKE